MPLGVGYGAGGAFDGLDQILMQRLREQALQQQQQEAEFRRALQTRQADQDDRRLGQQDRAFEENARLRDDEINFKSRQAEDQFGAESADRADFANELVDLPPLVAKALRLQRASGRRVNPDALEDPGVVQQRAFDAANLKRRSDLEDYEAKQQIEAKYRPPTQGREESRTWVIREGQPIRVSEAEIRPGDTPYDAVAARGQDKAGDGLSPYADERTTRTTTMIDDLIPKVTRWSTGWGSVLANWPETDARDFKTNMEALKANIGFNELTAMREASKTGGALGNVSNVELNLLTSALAGLDQAQSPAQVIENLKKAKASVMRWRDAVTKNRPVPTRATVNPAGPGGPAAGPQKADPLGIR